MKAIAINTIHLGKKPGEMSQDGKTIVKPAVVDIVLPGQEFDADEKEVRSLIESGFAKAATKAEAKA